MRSRRPRVNGVVRAALQAKYPAADIEGDATLRGHISGRRQSIDLIVRESGLAGTVLTAIDVSRAGRSISVKHAEAFISVLRDTGIERGVIVGSSETKTSALDRARAERFADVDILTRRAFDAWCPSAMIALSSTEALSLAAPAGWVVDPTSRDGALAHVHRRGLTLAAAKSSDECVSVRLWQRFRPVDSIDGLMREHEMQIRSVTPSASVVGTRRTHGAHAVLRSAAPGERTIQLVGFAELPTLLVTLTALTPESEEAAVLRRLNYMLGSVRPVQAVAPRQSHPPRSRRSTS